MRKKLIITGLSGVVGRNLVHHFDQNSWEIYDFFHTKPSSTIPANQSISVDICDQSAVEKAVKSIKPDVILHMAAATHVDACEQDRKNGEKGSVWKLNVEATRYLVSQAQNSDARFIYLSTESVFGSNNATCPKETALRNAKSWYGITKTKGEEIVESIGTNATIIRSVITYSTDITISTMYAKMYRSFQTGKPWFAVDDQLIAPTELIDLQKGISTVIHGSIPGIVHVVNPKTLTPFAFAQKIAQFNSFNPQLVSPQNMNDYFGTQAADYRVPYACLNAVQSTRLLGFIPRTVDEVLQRTDS